MVGTSCTLPRMTPQMCLDGQLRGTVFESWSLFKETDSDPNYDYYVAQTYVTWKMTGGADFGAGNAPGWIQIWSDKAASGGFFDGNESASVGPSFCADLSIGAQIGFFSITANPRLCNSAWLNMTTLNATNAIWRTDMVHHTPKWDLWYAIKVPAGVKPKFTFVLTFPYFTVYTHTGSQPTYDKLYYSYSIAVTA
jgi:hypothetical protein